MITPKKIHEANGARQLVTVTQRLTQIEKLTRELIERIGVFYQEEIDKQYVESANLNSRIELQTRRNPESGDVQSLAHQKAQLDKLIKPHQQKNQAVLGAIVNQLINSRNSRRHLEIVLGTILLNFPIDRRDSKFLSRIEISKMLKPVYQSALITLLFEQLVKEQHKFSSGYLAEQVEKISHLDGEKAQEALSELQKVFVEIIFIKEMGLFTPTALEILDSADENNALAPEQRKALLVESRKGANEFHHYGIGPVDSLEPAEEPKRGAPAAQKPQGKEALEAQEAKRNEEERLRRRYLQEQADRFAFIRDVLDPKQKQHAEIEELLKVCQVYTSFILSIKAKVDKEMHIKAYSAIEQHSQEKRLNPYFCEKLLQMMGRFPIGSGIYFIDERRNSIERGTVDKALVIGLNPDHPDEPIVKRVTTKYKYRMDARVGTIDRTKNLYFEQARSPKLFTPELKKRFATQYLNEDDPVHFSFRANEAFRTLSISEKSLW
ncbi:MAG: hypothetical protein ACPG4U_08740 [Pseudomonadales bacterium]